jgi:hypothetical protein
MKQLLVEEVRLRLNVAEREYAEAMSRYTRAFDELHRASIALTVAADHMSAVHTKLFEAIKEVTK